MFDETEAFVGDRKNEASPLEVWMDGECSLCQASQKWCELRGSVGRVRFIDFRKTGENDLPVTRSHHERSMWVRDIDGTLHEGFAAWRRIMVELGGWKRLARIASFPPFSLIGPPLYRLIAAHRHSLR